MFERIDRADYSIMTQVKGNLDLAIPLSLYLPEPTILDVRRIMTERAFRDPIIAGLPDSASELKKGWQRFNAMSERDQRQEVASTLRRLVDMLITPQRYFMLTQYRSGLRIRQWLDEGKMVVCNLAGGQMEDSTARLLGNLVLAVFMNEAMVRPVGEPRVWRLVADEFDRLAGNNFAELIEKARSRKVFPIMAHQNLDQLKRDRGNNLSLYQSARAVPVVFTFRASADDVYSLRRIHGDDYGEGLSTMKDFTAQLTLTRGLPGLVDPGQPVTILLDPLQGEDNEAALAAAILSQKAHTVSERALVRRGKIEGDDDTPRPNPLPQDRQPVPPGDDPTGDRSPGSPPPVPSLNQLAGLQTPVPRAPQQSGSTKRRSRSKAGRQPLLPETPQGPGSGQSQSHPPAGQPDGQVGDELSDQERPRPAGELPSKPQPGHQPLPPREPQLPDDQ